MSDLKTEKYSMKEMPSDLSAELQAAARTTSQWKVELRPQSISLFYRRVNRAQSLFKAVERILSTSALDRIGAEKDTSLRDVVSAQRSLLATLRDLGSMNREIRELPRILSSEEDDQPRVLKMASSYLAICRRVSVASLLEFVRGVQEHEALTVAEIWCIPLFLRFALLERILTRTERILKEQASDELLRPLVEDFRKICNLDWVTILEPLIAMDSLLRNDPADSYAQMEFESRETYRRRIAFVARYSDCSELEVASQVLQFAGSAPVLHCDERQRSRRLHVGYYLFEEGFRNLSARVGYHPPLAWRLRELVRSTPSDFYITGIQLVTLVLLSVVLFPLIGSSTSLLGMGFALLLLIMPAMQCAVELVNNCVSAVFEPEIIPKLDFSKGIPADCTTLVAVPTLLLNEKQLRQLFRDLEVRFLGNRDENLHFALLTDLPDSVSKPVESDHVLVHLAIQLTNELNAKYSSPNSGRFFLLHRRSTFNVRQGVWMGWERKRGKLLDLNKFLLGESDAFPIKAGPTDKLASVRYVLTLDSDTCLPRETACRLVGAMAHPLNRAVIDPQRRVVTHGYGILQPRIGVSVQSQARSRLAAIYSGQSGLDIYSHAVSDAYQDLYKEGIYTGKGIYDIHALHQVLDRRFPKNSLLSHDLIEGAYARAGLLTDVELIDDYPSHYSAYMRRKHRWVRGDWQIAQWILGKVPDESGAQVSSPISSISRWKIFDNLRRSLVEPFTLMLFIAGWFVLPGGPAYWTLVSLLLFLFPTFVQFLFSVGRAIASGRPGALVDCLSSSGKASAAALLNLCFLPHQAMLAIDAIVRVLVRQFITGRRLLEWETAAQAETATSSIVDQFLLAIPALACGLGAWNYLRGGREVFSFSLPILALWCLATVLTVWLNRPPRSGTQSLSLSAQKLLQIHALRIWRYFSEYGGRQHNFLIPDNVEEEGLFEAARVSPTNVGLLLNARQAACEFGFLSVPEFASLTASTLKTIAGLEKYRGHLYNWYDTRTCKPLEQFPFVSTVDSGNFVASLYALASGARRMMAKPLLDRSLFTGLKAHLEILKTEHRLPAAISDIGVPSESAPVSDWLGWIRRVAQELPVKEAEPGRQTKDWWRGETGRRLQAVLSLYDDYLPWLLFNFASLRSLLGVLPHEQIDCLSIDEALRFVDRAERQLSSAVGTSNEQDCLTSRFYVALAHAKENLYALKERLEHIVATAEEFAAATEFAFLAHPERHVLSIGFDVRSEKLHDACYDTLASEARIATYIAIARNELPQRVWFRLSREFSKAFGQYVLQSWTGTAFEYLMPALWMRFHPGTVIGESTAACVRVQRAFAKRLRIPWGISESGRAEKDDSGHYLYRAFGVPAIAASADATAGPVVSPYSTYLALCVDPKRAVQNLKRMTAAGWVGDYGLYEAGDFTLSRRNCEIVREWMAHHQGMSLIAILNCLKNDLAQQWFHEHAIMESAELLLSEVAPNRTRLKQVTRGPKAVSEITAKLHMPKFGFAMMKEAIK